MRVAGQHLREIIGAGPRRSILDIVVARHVLGDNSDAVIVVLGQLHSGGQTNHASPGQDTARLSNRPRSQARPPSAVSLPQDDNLRFPHCSARDTVEKSRSGRRGRVWALSQSEAKRDRLTKRQQQSRATACMHIYSASRKPARPAAGTAAPSPPAAQPTELGDDSLSTGAESGQARIASEGGQPAGRGAPSSDPCRVQPSADLSSSTGVKLPE